MTLFGCIFDDANLRQIGWSCSSLRLPGSARRGRIETPGLSTANGRVCLPAPGSRGARGRLRNLRIWHRRGRHAASPHQAAPAARRGSGRATRPEANAAPWTAGRQPGRNRCAGCRRLSVRCDGTGDCAPSSAAAPAPTVFVLSVARSEKVRTDPTQTPRPAQSDPHRSPHQTHGAEARLPGRSPTQSAVSARQSRPPPSARRTTHTRRHEATSTVPTAHRPPTAINLERRADRSCPAEEARRPVRWHLGARGAVTAPKRVTAR